MTTVRHYSPLFTTVRHYSHYSRLFALFGTIRYSLFAIRYSLFGFSRHPPHWPLASEKQNSDLSFLKFPSVDRTAFSRISENEDKPDRAIITLAHCWMLTFRISLGRTGCTREFTERVVHLHQSSLGKKKKDDRSY